MTISTIILEYVCPSLGCIMASVMFAAPISDLRNALAKGSLGPLNPFPWSMMTGNCLGWVAYGYYIKDPFVVAANVPGLILSLWLNIGASKLQYLDRMNMMKESNSDRQSLLLQQEQQQHLSHTHEQPEFDADPAIMDDDDDAPTSTTTRQRRAEGGSNTKNDDDDIEMSIMVSQERALLRVLVFWTIILIYVGWFNNSIIDLGNDVDPATIIGIVVNINLVFFYGAPLQTIQHVIKAGTSDSIHLPSMFMTCTNTSFWIAYGMAVHNAVIVIPNSMGLVLGLIQALLCCLYPRINNNNSSVGVNEHNNHHSEPNSSEVQGLAALS